MSIYNHDDLSKIFKKSRFLDENHTMLEYTTVFDSGLILVLHIWPYDEYASIVLWRSDKESWLFHTDVNHLEKIICDGDSLKIFRDENKIEPAVVLTIKPNISLSCEAAAPKKKP